MKKSIRIKKNKGEWALFSNSVPMDKKRVRKNITCLVLNIYRRVGSPSGHYYAVPN